MAIWFPQERLGLFYTQGQRSQNPFHELLFGESPEAFR